MCGKGLAEPGAERLSLEIGGVRLPPGWWDVTHAPADTGVRGRELGLRHIITQVGRTSLLSRDSGLLVASRFPVLYQHFVAFPWHREVCSTA